eukprot:SAG31_NODE_1114_length_9852_cov_2.761509_2_plen_63_part_00
MLGSPVPGFDKFVLQVEKILKSLVKKNLIKMEKTVLRQNGKMYFLYDVEPSVEHSGGVWYSR